MEKDSDDFGCFMTVIFGYLAIVSFGLIIYFFDNLIVAVIALVIFILIAGICAGCRDGNVNSVAP